MTELLLDDTHDAAARSWISSANDPASSFPIQNLPIGVFRRKGSKETFRAGVAIGTQILDLVTAGHAGVLGETSFELVRAQTTLNHLASQGRAAVSALRHELFALLREDTPGRNAELQVRIERCLVPQGEAEYALPTEIGDYTDFYTSSFHAANISKLIKPDQPPLTPNFQHLPNAYHGRASSVGISGQKVWRPMGQYPGPDGQPVYGPCQRLDFELELGFVIGPGNQRGQRIAIADADQHIIGLCLLNDWSARDIQFWESVPLGPFLAKNFATTISPWLVSLDALAPFRQPSLSRTAADPTPLPYLRSDADDALGAIDIKVQASLQTAQMRRVDNPGEVITSTTFAHQYWTIAQMLAHHSVGGCQLRSGDLLGTGTISGPGEGEAGALIELAKNGASPVRLSTGETRAFLEDGDAIILNAWCERPGFRRIGFGESRSTVERVIP